MLGAGTVRGAVGAVEFTFGVGIVAEFNLAIPAYDSNWNKRGQVKINLYFGSMS